MNARHNVGAAIAGLALLVSVSTASAQLGEHYLCYKGGTASGTPKFVAASKILQDQFDVPGPGITYLAKKAQGLCNPAQKNNEAGQPLHPLIHQVNYQIKAVAGSPKFV